MTLPLQFYSLNFNPENPIPNGPFYSPLTNALQSVAGPLVVGAGISVDYATSTISASGSGGTVTAVTGTAPISVTAGNTPVVSIAASSTTVSGAVQLYNNVNSTSTSLALTAAQGKVLQDQITALATAPNIELAGTLDATTGFVDSVTSVGTTAGYTVGAVLPAADATTVNTYVIVTTAGTVTPPGGSATVASRGDWFLVSETTPGVYSWQFLNVGFDGVVPASTTVAGIVCLSTDALALAGTDATTALTPAAACCAFIQKSTIAAKGSLISGTAACTPASLAVGTDGQVLSACSTAATGLCWTALATATPIAFGTVLGCTNATNSALGCNALLNNTGTNNVAIGLNAGCSITTGCFNVAIGSSASVASPTGSCQLALGYTSACNWLTGDSSKHIQPGAGIRDCAGNLGTSGQVLSSTGTALLWSSGSLPASFTSAGTLQSVGLTATGGVDPVPSLTLRNNVSYRQIGVKQWEVFYTLTAFGAWTNAGSGDYLFTLPNSLNFDITLPWQPVWTGSVGAGSQENRWYWIPGASSIQIGTNSSGSIFGNGVAVYNATQFRVFATDSGNSDPAPVSSTYWGGLPTTNFSIGFQFTSA
jgi:hypothetical protein